MWIPFQPTTLQKSRTSGPKVSLPPPHWERGHPRPRPPRLPIPPVPTLGEQPFTHPRQRSPPAATLS